MLILASRSPRRAELLRNAGIPFTVRGSDVDETPRERENPEDYAQRVAEAKVLAIQSAADDVVLGADTVVVIDGQMLGKPADEADAERMLRLLSGRRHHVITGICVKRANCLIHDWSNTNVWFHPLSDQEIGNYVASGEPMDKAGAYAIQGLASKFIDRIDGSYANVVGLPVALVYKHLQ